jgi:hypothetical protein
MNEISHHWITLCKMPKSYLYYINECIVLHLFTFKQYKHKINEVQSSQNFQQNDINIFNIIILKLT